MRNIFAGRFLPLAALLLAGAALAALDIKPGNDYDLLLADGETLKKIRIKSADAVMVVGTVSGLAEELRIPRRAIRSAVLLVKKPFFREFALQAFGDFQLALADLRLLSPYF